MSDIQIPANHDYDAFLQGQIHADQPKKRAMSMLLAIVAGLLLYTGLKASPMDERLTYAGVLTLIYIFFGRTFMFKIKVKNHWKQIKETNPELILDKKGVQVKGQLGAHQKSYKWADFGFYRIEDKQAFIYPKQNPENWLTLSLKDISAEDRLEVVSLIKGNIKIIEQKKQ